jgi:hypothetical protein
MVQGQQYGPVDDAAIREWIKSGRVQPSDHVWTEGMAQWQPASQVAALSDAFADPSREQGAAQSGPAPVEGLYQPPQPQVPYEAQAQPYTPTRPLKAHRGGQVLVFGILGMVCCLIFGIIAWSQGSSDIKEMDAGVMDPSGRGLTQAGRILGIIGCVLGIIGLLVNLGTFAAA